ncbi:MAG TPA: hypothetical protein VHO70_23045 [Chitinispirillaceae bacterium]|nr:hypothetical protein [Chitinispirillaceae bacterium]
MKYFTMISLLLFLLSPCKAQDTILRTPTPRFEIGVVLGEPVGVSAKFWHGTITATDITAAWSFTENGLFEFHIDFLLHLLNLRIIGAGGNSPVYIGAGPAVRIGNEWFLGARVPIGVEYIFRVLPIALFGEIAPQWQFIPDNMFVFGGGAGIRFKFGSID